MTQEMREQIAAALVAQEMAQQPPIVALGTPEWYGGGAKVGPYGWGNVGATVPIMGRPIEGPGGTTLEPWGTVEGGLGFGTGQQTQGRVGGEAGLRWRF